MPFHSKQERARRRNLRLQRKAALRRISDKSKSAGFQEREKQAERIAREREKILANREIKKERERKPLGQRFSEFSRNVSGDNSNFRRAKRRSTRRTNRISTASRKRTRAPIRRRKATISRSRTMFRNEFDTGLFSGGL